MAGALNVEEVKQFKDNFCSRLTGEEKQFCESVFLWELLQESHNVWLNNFMDWVEAWEKISKICNEHRTLFWQLIVEFACFSETVAFITDKTRCRRSFTTLMCQLAAGLRDSDA